MRNDIGFKVDAGLEKRDEDGRVVHTMGGRKSRVGGGTMGSPCLGARVEGGVGWSPGEMGAGEFAAGGRRWRRGGGCWVIPLGWSMVVMVAGS